MIDNLSQALTERDNEVLELKKSAQLAESELESLKTQNTKFEKQV